MKYAKMQIRVSQTHPNRKRIYSPPDSPGIYNPWIDYRRVDYQLVYYNAVDNPLIDYLNTDNQLVDYLDADNQ